MCSENDRDVFGDVVDHKFPVRDGGLVHCSDAGIWVLCVSCHSLKTMWEAYARENGLLDRIVDWCDRPEMRPKFREVINARV